MNPEQIGKEMFTLWKAQVDAYLKSLEMAQEQGEKMFDLFFERGGEMADEFKKGVKESMENSKKAQEAYVAAFKDNVTKMEEMLNKHK